MIQIRNNFLLYRSKYYKYVDYDIIIFLKFKTFAKFINNTYLNLRLMNKNVFTSGKFGKKLLFAFDIEKSMTKMKTSIRNILQNHQHQRNR